MTSRERWLRMVWLAVKIAVLVQFAAAARDFAYQGF